MKNYKKPNSGGGIARCPRCKEEGIPAGKYLELHLAPFVQIRFFFLIRRRVKLDIYYCPNCGYLRVEINGVRII